MAKNKSPLYNYRSPRDYKVFNMGNEASPPFKMKGYSPYTGSSFKMKKYNSPAYQKQEDWEPAYPGADYSKEELEMMSAEERATAEGQAKLKMMKGASKAKTKAGREGFHEMLHVEKKTSPRKKK